jgi:membrane associated rhomboid family serine protease
MLEDRDYMRQPDFYHRRMSFAILLLIINTIVFVGQLITSHSLQAQEFEGTYLALSLDGIKHFYLWQLLTFQFMHAGLLHILFNSLAIYFFGRPVENAFGGKRFLTIYFVSGVIGGLVQMLFALLIPSFDGPVVGASAGASGLVAAFAVLNWNQPFTIFLYFLPVTMRGKTLLWVSIALAVVGMLTPSNVANAAHLGGILTGFIFARHLINRSWSPPSGENRMAFLEFFARRKKAKKDAADLSAEEYLQKEVDPILEKISAHGIQSLTAREREILEKARSKMDRR